jgi:hypothetical protein
MRCSWCHPSGFVRSRSRGPNSADTEVYFVLAVILAWQLRIAYRRRRACATGAVRFSYMHGTAEKPAFITLTDSKNVDGPHKISLPVSDPSTRWEPQIKSVTLPSGVTVPPIAVTAPERSPKVHDELLPTPKSGPALSPLPSPPPAYRILGLHTIPIPSSPPDPDPFCVPPPTPMHKSPGKTVSTPVRESLDLSPIPSPRSASFYPNAVTPPAAPQAGLPTTTAPKSLPRLMAVATSFQPTRPDELSLRTGETLRLIREFDDEWCLVQRVGHSAAEKGVVPRFCLTERPRLIKSCVRFSNSILNGVRRK